MVLNPNTLGIFFARRCSNFSLVGSDRSYCLRFSVTKFHRSFGGVPSDLSGYQPQACAGARSIWRYAERVQPEDQSKPAELPGSGRLLQNTAKRDSKPAEQFGARDQSGAGHVVQLTTLVGPGGTPQPEKFPGTGITRSQQKPEKQPRSSDRLEDVAHVRERESTAAS